MGKLLFILLTLALDGIIPAGDAFLRPLQKRDSILVADQLEYGFELKDVDKGTVLALPDYSVLSNDTLTLVRGWKIDTLKRHKRKGTFNIRGTVVVAPFEEGTYRMPPVFLLREQRDSIDTLGFAGVEFRVAEFPVDTARVQQNKLLPLMTYPITFAELLPWILGGLAFSALIAGLIIYLKRRRARFSPKEKKDPAHVVALRELDRYRDRKFWAPEKQKAFYSGVTDALKNYIDERFTIDAPEMTTAELFAALKGNKDIEPDMFAEMKNLFESADFVKFAKFTASDEENAKVLPTAVRFVTSTYQAEVEQQAETEKGGQA